MLPALRHASPSIPRGLFRALVLLSTPALLLAQSQAATLTPVRAIPVPLDAPSIREASFSTSGALAVVTRDNRLLHYSASLNRGAYWGGLGEGPGEFRAPVLAFWQSDSLAVFDAALRRLSVFGPSGRLVRSQSLFDWHEAVPVGQPDPASLVATLHTLPGRITSGDSLKLLLVGTEGVGAAKVLSQGTVASRVGEFHAKGGPRVSFTQPIREVIGHFYSARDGHAVAVESRAPARGSDSAALAVSGSPVRGGSSRSATFQLPAVRRSVQDQRAFVDSMIANFRRDPSAAPVNALRDPVADALYSPPFLPLLRKAYADPSGGLWTWVTKPGHSPGALCRIPATGPRLACADVPSGAHPVAVGPERRMLMLSHGKDGEPMLHEYRFDG